MEMISNQLKVDSTTDSTGNKKHGNPHQKIYQKKTWVTSKKTWVINLTNHPTFIITYH